MNIHKTIKRISAIKAFGYRKTLMPLFIICIAAMSALLSSCNHIDDDRLPPMPVRIGFNTVGDWNLYGVGGAGIYRYFIPPNSPQGYPYTALSYTGLGGVLLIGDVHGNPRAYDLACPVECRSDVRIVVDPESLTAECPSCHSTYDVVSNYGYPLSGKAAERGYGLQKYNVGPGPSGEYMLIWR